jgi:hypothetical protein
MFEQSLYNQEAFAPVPEAHEGDLFYKYEIKNWNLGPRLYKILGASALVNVLFLAFVTQTNLLTRKGCDSPITSTVCQVIDMAFVADTIFGTKRDYVDEVYEKTSLRDADVTFVDVSNAEPQLEYPEGYFALANPEQAAMLAQLNDTNNSYTPPPPLQNDLLHTTPIIPKANPNAVDGDLPSSPLGPLSDDSNSSVGINKKVRGPRFPGVKTNDNSSNSNTMAKATPTPEATPMSSEAVAQVQINKKPLTDYADMVESKWANNEIDLNQPFTIVLNAVLTPDGKLDPKKSVFDVTKEKGDQKMIDIAKSALEAVADSGYLTYLKSLNVDKVTVTLVQDDTQITAAIVSSQKTAERAKTISSGLNGYIVVGKMTAKDPSDELTLLKGASVTTSGKDFVLNFAIPKPIAQEMINRKLKEAQAKKAQVTQPNSSAIGTPNVNTAKFN